MIHYKNMLTLYSDFSLALNIENFIFFFFFLEKKKEKKKKRRLHVFIVFAQIIDCGFMLELRRGSSNNYQQSYVFGQK